MNTVWKGWAAMQLKTKLRERCEQLRPVQMAPTPPLPLLPAPPYLTVYRIGAPYQVVQFLCFVLFFVFLQVFTGNSDRTSIVKHSLRTDFKARYVPFYPVTYHNWPCLRVEIFVLK